MIERFSRVRRAFGSSWRLVHSSSRALVWAVLVVAVVSAGLVAVEVSLLQRLVAGLEAASTATNVVIAFGLATVARRVLGTVSAQLQWLISQQVDRHVSELVVGVASLEPFASFEDPDFQDKMQRALSAGQGQAWSVVWSLVTVVRSLVTALALVLVTAAVVPDLLTILFPVGLGILVLAILRSRWAFDFDYAQTQPDRERRYLRRALTSRSEGKEIRLHGSRNVLLSRHHDLYEERLSQAANLVKRRLSVDLLLDGGLAVALVLALLAIAGRTADGTLSLADAAAAAVALHQLINQLQAAANGVGGMVQSMLFVEQIDGFTNRPGEGQSPPIGAFDGIEMANVSFTYPDSERPSLVDVSLRLEPGEVVAVVGENGAGKSTLAKLLLGLYRAESGAVTVTIDGVAHDLDGPLVGTAAAVFQDYATYELSVAENVWLGAGDREVSPDLVDQALEVMGLTERVTVLPEGSSTRLGREFTGGLDLSTGEWQRLAVARAWYSQAPVVVLDEPTASVDAPSEAKFFAELRDAFAGRSVLLNSHRFSTVRSADRILVLHEGRLAEQGTHEELVELGGVYAALFDARAQSELGNEKGTF